ncbi:secreted protein, partial [Candidatus Thiomargarita nelsonii]
MKLKWFIWIITLCSLVPGSVNDLFAQAPWLSVEQEEQLKLAKIYNNQVVEYYQQGLSKKALPLAKKVF